MEIQAEENKETEIVRLYTTDKTPQNTRDSSTAVEYYRRNFPFICATKWILLD